MGRIRNTRTVAVAVASVLIAVTAAAAGPAGAMGGAISGTVTSDGSPVGRIEVCALSPTLESIEYGCTFTERDGTYAIPGLADGTYVIRFVDPGGPYVWEYSGDSLIHPLATRVVVSSSAVTSGVDADLEVGGEIWGHVTDRDGPVDGASVCVSSAVVPYSKCATSGSTGFYTVRNLPVADDYTVLFSNGDSHGFEFFDDDPSDPTPVSVRAGQVTPDVDAVLSQTGAIQGSVTDASGQPLADVSIAVSSPEFGTQSSVVTDAAGRYTMSGLPPDQYTVVFVPPSPYLPRYFDGSDDEAGATPVTVSEAATTTGVDAQLAVGGSISGTVTDADGPLSGATVCAGVRCASTGADGTYRIDGLAPDPVGYVVRFFGFPTTLDDPAYVSELYDDVTDETQATLVPVTGGPATPNIDAELAVAGTISGRVVDEAGQPVQDVSVEAIADGVGAGFGGLTDADGRYTVLGLDTGDYRVAFADVTGVHAFQFHDGASSLGTGTPVSVTRGADTPGIDAQLTRRRVFRLLDEACTVLDAETLRGGDSVVFDVAGALPVGQDPSPATCPIPAEADGVVANVVVENPVAAGNLRLTPAGAEPQGGIVNFAANGLGNSNAQSVPLSVDQRLDLSVNGGPGGVGQIVADGARVEVAGWYQPTAGQGPAGAGELTFTPVTPCAFLDSRPTQGGSGDFAGPFTSDVALAVDVEAAVPSSQGGGNSDCGAFPFGPGAVLVNVVLVNTVGTATVTSPVTGLTVVNNVGQEPQTNNSSAVILPVDVRGRIHLDVAVSPGGSTHVRAVVLGSFQRLYGEFGASFGIGEHQTVPPCATFDSRETQGASGEFAGVRLGDQTTTYDVVGAFDPAQGGGSGDCGIPDGAVAVEINLVGVNPEREGNLRVAAEGEEPTGGVLNFARLATPMNNSNAIVLPVSDDGRITVTVNGGSGGIGLPVAHVRGVVSGYYLPR